MAQWAQNPTEEKPQGKTTEQGHTQGYANQHPQGLLKPGHYVAVAILNNPIECIQCPGFVDPHLTGQLLQRWRLRIPGARVEVRQCQVGQYLDFIQMQSRRVHHPMLLLFEPFREPTGLKHQAAQNTGIGAHMIKIANRHIDLVSAIPGLRKSLNLGQIALCILPYPKTGKTHYGCNTQRGGKNKAGQGTQLHCSTPPSSLQIGKLTALG